jgi:FO synthase
MEAMIRAAGRRPRQRTTLYRAVDAERARRSFDAAPLAPVVQTPVRTRRRTLSHVIPGPERSEGARDP